MLKVIVEFKTIVSALNLSNFFSNFFPDHRLALCKSGVCQRDDFEQLVAEALGPGNGKKALGQKCPKTKMFEIKMSKTIIFCFGYTYTYCHFGHRCFGHFNFIEFEKLSVNILTEPEGSF
jgi:hypothetical protein